MTKRFDEDQNVTQNGKQVRDGDSSYSGTSQQDSTMSYERNGRLINNDSALEDDAQDRQAPQGQTSWQQTEAKIER